MKKPISALLLCLLLLAMAPPETPKEIPLWPKGAPGSEGKTARAGCSLGTMGSTTKPRQKSNITEKCNDHEFQTYCCG